MGSSAAEPPLLAEAIALAIRAKRAAAIGCEIDALAVSAPDHPRLLEFRGELDLATGDYAAAAAYFQVDRQRRPHDAAAALRLARALHKGGRIDTAIAALREGLAALPASPRLLPELALLQLKAGAIDAAKESLDLLVSAYPDHPRSHVLYGKLAETVGDFSAALACYQADYRRHPGDSARRHRLVRAVRRTQHPDAAIAILRDVETPDATDLAIMAECLVKAGRWAELDALAGRYPIDGSAGDMRGAAMRIALRLALARFDFDRAATVAAMILEVDPDDRQGLNGLAQAEFCRFRAEAAMAAIHRLDVKRADGGGTMRGRLLKSYFGHVVNDLRLRPESSAELARAACEHPDRLAHAGARLLREDHGDFGAALALLLGLARARRIGQFAPAPAGADIPRALHQYWDDASPPSDVAMLMDDTAAKHQGWSYRRWDDASARDWLAARAVPLVARAFRAARHPAMRADLLRLAILGEEGGAYLDSDDFCAVPLAALLRPGARLVCAQETLGSIGNNVLAAMPRHPLILRARDEAAAAVLSGAAESIWLSTGPGLMSRIIGSAIAAREDLAVPPGLRITPLEEVRRVIQAHRKLGYKNDARGWKNAA